MIVKAVSEAYSIERRQRSSVLSAGIPITILAQILAVKSYYGQDNSVTSRRQLRDPEMVIKSYLAR